jgi:UDP:flavonoid glycosyltransferase YjiC (YdhE family)
VSRRILVAPCVGSDGVLLPHLAVAQALRQRGHRVYFYAPSWAAARARQAGCVPLEMPSGNVYRTYLASKPGEQHVSRALEALAQRVAPDLLRQIARLRIDGLVIDSFAHLGAAVAAEASGVAWASLAHTPWMLAPEFRGSSLGKIGINPLRARLGLRPSEQNAFDQCTSPHLHLLAWPREFDLQPPPTHSFHVGPLGWSPLEAEPPAWAKSLGRSAPAVLVATSSYPMDRYRELERKFFSAAVGALGRMPVEAVVTMSGKLKPVSRKSGRTNVRIERYVPHELLMPRLSALVTHGGWGSIGRALRFGVPVLVVPFGIDHPTNGMLCERAGVGLTLPIAQVGQGPLRERLEAMLDPNGSMRLASRALSRRIRRVPPEERAASAVMKLIGA